MPERNITEVGTIRLGTEDYSLVRTDEFKQAWNQVQVDEPPWEGGLPPMLSAVEETWHLGGFKSREGIAGTTEYGDTDDRWPFQMLPGPHVYDLTLPDSEDPPTSFFECLDYIFVVAGRYCYRVHKTTFAVTKSKDLSGGINSREGVMGLRWEGTFGMVATKDWYLWKVSAIGTPDTWSYSTAGGSHLAAALDRLFKVDDEGLLRNASTGLDPMLEASYADKVQCGPAGAEGPTALAAYENSVLVGRHVGLFGVSADEGVGVPLIKRMVRDDDNCLGMCVVEPHILVPHRRGLYRLRPGVSVESAGLEREVLNRTPMAKSRFRCFAVDNQWVYGGLEGPSGVTSYVVVGRDRRGGEPGLSPIIWDTFIDLGTATLIRAMHVSVLTATPTLFFGKGVNAAYIKLPTGGGVPSTDCTFAASNARYSPRYNFGDWNDKDFPKVEVAARSVDALRYWSVAYRVDDGSWITVDDNGAAMDIKTEGVKTFYFASTAVGKEIQYRFTYTGTAEYASPVQLIYFKRFAVPQSKKVPVITAILHLAADIRHDMAKEARDAVGQFNDLNTLSKQADSVACTYEPWGGDIRVWVRHIRLLQVIQEGIGEPEFLVEATLQQRETA